MQSAREIKIKDYVKFVTGRIASLDVLRSTCQYNCINGSNDDDIFKEELQKIIQTKTDEEWNQLCRGLEPICQEYYNGVHLVDNLVTELNDLAKQIAESLKTAKITRIYIHPSQDDTAEKQKSLEMTPYQLKEKLNQIINTCSSKFTFRKCEMRKIQVYVHVIDELNRDVQSMWNIFLKKYGLKSKNVNMQTQPVEQQPVKQQPVEQPPIKQQEPVEQTLKPLLIPSPIEVRIKDYENVSEWFASLKHLRSLCKTECLRDVNVDPQTHADVYEQLQKMMDEKIDEEWNSVCRHRPSVVNCKNYYNAFHKARALVLRLDQLCKQINDTYVPLKDRMQYVFSTDEYDSHQKQKILEMTVQEFEKKINQKITACLGRFNIRKCEVSKIKSYIDIINELNKGVSLKWEAFMKEITPVNDTDMIKNILKTKINPKLLSNISVVKDPDSELYSVKGELIPSFKVNPITQEVIEISNIQAAGAKKHTKTRNKKHKKRHSKRHLIRRSKRHSIRH